MLTEYEAQKLQADLTHDSHASARHRQLRDMHREPVWRVVVALKCAVCLVMLAGLAVIAITTEVEPEPSLASVSALDPEGESGAEAKQTSDRSTESEQRQQSVSSAEQAPSERPAVKAERHRKAVFDERRRAWEARRYSSDKKIAGGNAP